MKQIWIKKWRLVEPTQLSETTLLFGWVDWLLGIVLIYDVLWYKLLFNMTKVVVIIVNSVNFFDELDNNLIYLHLAYIPLRDFLL